MAVTTIGALRDGLNALGIEHASDGPDVTATLTVASVFDPVERGFYFLTGTTVPAGIRNSVLLVRTGFDAGLRGDNTLLLVRGDPQYVYYKLLNALFDHPGSTNIASTARIDPGAVLGAGVRIGEYAIIGACMIGDGVTIGSHVVVHDESIIDSGAAIDSHSAIGARGVAWVWDEAGVERVVQPQLGGVRIGASTILGAHTVVVRGSLNEKTVIGDATVCAPGCRIGHGTVIGRQVHLANAVVTGGNSRIGDFSFIGSAAVFRPKVAVHPRTIVAAGAVVVRNTSAAGLTLMGVPAREEPTKDLPSGMPRPKPPSEGTSHGI
jgi:UDP-3-O-[3-hydroxymyristoyl] glucosamine N-acyltransferase